MDPTRTTYARWWRSRVPPCKTRTGDTGTACRSRTSYTSRDLLMFALNHIRRDLLPFALTHVHPEMGCGCELVALCGAAYTVSTTGAANNNHIWYQVQFNSLFLFHCKTASTVVSSILPPTRGTVAKRRAMIEYHIHCCFCELFCPVRYRVVLHLNRCICLVYHISLSG